MLETKIMSPSRENREVKDDSERRDRSRNRAGDEDRERDRDRQRERDGARDKDRSKARSRSRSPKYKHSRHSDRRDSERSRSKRKERKSDSTSGYESESDSDSGREGKRRKRRYDSETDEEEERRRRRRRREKKEEKRRRKERKKEKKSKSSAAVTAQWGLYGLISEADIVTKDSEFRTWLVEERTINPETISKDRSRKEFAVFVEDYNTATLPHEKYYDMAKYDIKMNMIRTGQGLPGNTGGYDPMADIKAHSSSLKKPSKEKETFLSRDEVEELRRLQAERHEIGKRKQMGLDVPTSLGVRKEEHNPTTFDY
ncbi:hypothetical protein P7C73_g2414, partial [Tremellales sp. Uapishka_1]